MRQVAIFLRAIKTFRRIDHQTFFGYPQIALAQNAPTEPVRERAKSATKSIEDVLKSRLDLYSSNEKGRTTRMASFAKANQQKQAQMMAEQKRIRAEKMAEQKANQRPLQKATRAQAAKIRKKW